jgi:hypothetical protein
MYDHSNFFALRQLGIIDDPLTDISRARARELLAPEIFLAGKNGADCIELSPQHARAFL